MAKADLQKVEHWRHNIESYKTSGLTRKAFCRKHRLNVHTLDYWRKKLKSIPAVSDTKNKNDFIQLQVSDDTRSDSCIKLRIGQVYIEVPDGFDPMHLKSILRVLDAAC